MPFKEDLCIYRIECNRVLFKSFFMNEIEIILRCNRAYLGSEPEISLNYWANILNGIIPKKQTIVRWR